MEWLIPEGRWLEHVIALITALAVTGLVVVIHYEGVHALARRYAGRTPKRDRGVMLRVIFALLGLHIVEIWCYGLAYWGLMKLEGLGYLHGLHGTDTLFDAVYLR